MTSHTDRDLVVAEKLGELTASVGEVSRSLGELKTIVENRFGPLEARVAALESLKYKIVGACALVVAVLEYVPFPFWSK